ncbi:MAG: XRE family transcriptional regulator [Nitrospirae bacterium]|nr:MAG: XRE family transcriptional regulator [Nitrospirota bacterium]
MKPSHHIQAWRHTRGYCLKDLADEVGIPISQLEAIEQETQDPPLTLLHQIGSALGIPTSWLVIHPKVIQFLQNDKDEAASVSSHRESMTLDYVWRGFREQEELYLQLAALIHHGDPKLIRAAAINLQSLLKQARTAALPWQSRPSGHFEPPSD